MLARRDDQNGRGRGGGRRRGPGCHWRRTRHRPGGLHFAIVLRCPRPHTRDRGLERVEGGTRCWWVCAGRLRFIASCIATKCDRCESYDEHEEDYAFHAPRLRRRAPVHNAKNSTWCFSHYIALARHHFLACRGLTRPPVSAAIDSDKGLHRWHDRPYLALGASDRYRVARPG